MHVGRAAVAVPMPHTLHEVHLLGLRRLVADCVLAFAWLQLQHLHVAAVDLLQYNTPGG